MLVLIWEHNPVGRHLPRETRNKALTYVCEGHEGIKPGSYSFHLGIRGQVHVESQSLPRSQVRTFQNYSLYRVKTLAIVLIESRKWQPVSMETQ